MQDRIAVVSPAGGSDSFYHTGLNSDTMSVSRGAQGFPPPTTSAALHIQESSGDDTPGFEEEISPQPMEDPNGDQAAGSTISAAVAPQQGQEDEDGGDESDDGGDGSQAGAVPAHENPRPIPDSEEHAVSFLGRLVIKGTEQEPPTGSACATAVDFLTKLSRKQRAKYCGTVAINLNMTISGSRTGIICLPRGNVPEGHHGLACNLIHVTCVADHGKHMCFITAKLQRDRSVKFHAYAFVCESDFASRYLAEEVVRACRHVFMIRRIQRARQQALVNNRVVANAASSPQSRVAPSPAVQEVQKEKEPEKAREPDDIDRLFYKEREILESAVKKAFIVGRAQVVCPKSPSRGNGIYYECCKSLGKCLCSMKDVVKPLGQRESSTSVMSTLSQTSNDPLVITRSVGPQH